MLYKDKHILTHGRFSHNHHRAFVVSVVAISICLLIFIFSSPYFNQISYPTDFEDDNNVIFTTSTPAISDTSITATNKTTINTTGHYKILLVIATKITHSRHRKILREYMFGIRNNLRPCMRQDGDVYYKFLARPYDLTPKLFLRDFRAESVEFDDIVEFPNHSDEEWQEIILDWAQDLAKDDITFDHLVMIKDSTVIDLHKLQLVLESSKINGQSLTEAQKSKLVWGSFESLLLDDAAIILGKDAIPAIIESKSVVKATIKSKPVIHGGKGKKKFVSTVKEVNLIGNTYKYYKQSSSDTDLYFVNDNVGIIEFPNSAENVPVNTTIAAGGVYLEDDLRDLISHLSIGTTLVCHPDENRSGIAVVTSSFSYDDLCMLPVVKITADNKRSYAQRHGYSFIGRSHEFSQQIFKDRKTVWGKFDAVEKILPLYDWLLWLDMDTIIANASVSVEILLKRFTEMAGGEEEFKKISLIVARPVDDAMINAGIFLMRNSDWSREFMRECQHRTDLYRRGMYEQRAMWELMKSDKWSSGVLFLDQDDHTFNTFPPRYMKGDFVVHYAPDDCPTKPILDALGKIKMLEEDPEIDISLAHGPDH